MKASLRAWVIHGIAVVATLAVFGLYTRPQFLVTLAEQVWACFQ